MQYSTYHQLLRRFKEIHGLYPDSFCLSEWDWEELKSGITILDRPGKPQSTGTHTKFQGTVLGIDVITDEKYSRNLFNMEYGLGHTNVAIHGNIEEDFFHN